MPVSVRFQHGYLEIVMRQLNLEREVLLTHMGGGEKWDNLFSNCHWILMRRIELKRKILIGFLILPLVALFMVAMFCLYVEMGRYVAIKGMAIFNTHERKRLKTPPRFIFYTTSIIVCIVLGWLHRRGKYRRYRKRKPDIQLYLFKNKWKFLGGSL